MTILQGITKDMKYHYIAVSCLCFVVLVKAQCPPRDLESAAIVGRPCEACTPEDSTCINSTVCMCDHECGYSCIDPLATCGSPTRIPNAKMIGVFRRVPNNSRTFEATLPYRYDDLTRYVCEPGYKHEGAQLLQRYCHSGGSWTGTAVCALSCRRYNEIEVVLNNQTCGGNCVTDEDCDEELRCRCDGACGRTCVDPDVDCGVAPAANNTRITYIGTGLERVAFYVCNDGYFIESGSPSRKCTGGGTWDGELITCSIVTCGDPSSSIVDMGGEITDGSPGPYYTRHSVTLSCGSNRTLIGSRRRICQSNGRWSGLDTVCDIVDDDIRCSHPGVPINGRLISDRRFNEGSFAEFECDPGYVMIGERRQECLYFLQWSGDGVPKCIDPRHRDHGDDVLEELSSEAANVQLEGDIVVGRGPLSQSPGYEQYYVIDISSYVGHGELTKSVMFAKQWIRKMSNEGVIRCAIIVYASTAAVIHELSTESSDDIVQIITNLLVDRQNIQARIGNERNTYDALQRLNETIYESLVVNPRIKRFVFLLIHGRQTTISNPPQSIIENMVNFYENYLPKIYVISFGTEVLETSSYAELQSLAVPQHRFLANPNLNRMKLGILGRFISEPDHPVNGKCGKAGDTGNIKARARIGRVIGGNLVNPRAWPWQAAITVYHTEIVTTYLQFLGGGSLINQQWVLTAAHLFNDVNTGPNWERNITVSFGLRSLPDGENVILSPNIRVFEVGRLIMHDQYIPGPHDYDIALLKLGRRYVQEGSNWRLTNQIGLRNYTEYIRPACLPCMQGNCIGDFLRRTRVLSGRESEEERCRIEGDVLLQRDEKETKNVKAVVTGFGQTNDISFLFDHLRQGLIRLKSHLSCQEGRDEAVVDGLSQSEVFTERMICGIGGKDGAIIDACIGDSGGPFVRELRDSATEESCWVQIGIVSWGYGCGGFYSRNGIRKYFPGFYTNLVSFMSWVKMHINQGNTNEPMVEHTCPRITGRVEEGRKCRKQCETDADCKGVLKRCGCDDVCGMSCFNPDAECVREEIDNGDVVGDARYGRSVTYVCNHGYVLEGTTSRTCRSDKGWSGSLPFCRAINCSFHEVQFASANTSQALLIAGNTVTYTCDRGYEMFGSASLTCLLSGSWSHEPPICLAARCRPPVSPQHGSAETDVNVHDYDSEVRYSCDPGFRLNGNAIGRCNEASTWGEIPTCTEITCPDRPLPEFATPSLQKSPWTVGDVLTITCNRGYVINGATSSICQSNGRWSDSLPTCLRSECQVPETSNELIKSTNRVRLNVDERLTYVCIQGFVMVNQPTGHLTVTCQSHDTWSDEVPECREQHCAVPDLPQGVLASTNQARVPFGSRVTYSCMEGYQMVGESRGTLTVTCQEDGLLSAGIPNCIEPRIECRRQIHLVEEGRQCRKQCKTDANCRGGLKICRCDDVCGMSCFNPSASCQALEPIVNGVVLGDNRTYRAIVTYVCNDGYVLRGNERRICRSDKMWSGTPPVCIEITCDVPNALENGLISTNRRRLSAGGTLTYTCANGYRMLNEPTGRLTVTCQNNNRFSQDPPRCVEITCDVPNVLENGLISTNRRRLSAGETLTYTCANGYRMLNQPTGRLTVTCQNNNRFSQDPPRCVEITCDVPNVLEHILISTNRRRLSESETLTYTCADGYRMLNEPTGRLIATCLNNNRFSQDPPACVELICDVPNALEHISISINRRRLSAGETLTYTCVNGYRMLNERTGQLTVTCQNNNRLSQNPPRCVEITCDVPNVLEHISVSTNRRRLSESETLTYTCADGYRMLNEPTGQLIATCQNNNRFSQDPPRCVELICDVPNALENGLISTNRRRLSAGETLTYTCADEYRMLNQPTGRLTVTCQNRNNRLSQNPPRCVATWSDWGEWSSCSVTCENGVQRRSRSCGKQTSGAKSCGGSYTRSRTCNRDMCYTEIRVGNRAYTFFPVLVNYERARQNCEGNSGDDTRGLAIIRNENVQNAIAAQMLRLPGNEWTLYYVGMRREDDDNWYYRDGVRVALRSDRRQFFYQNWNIDEPNNYRGIEDCGAILRRNGRWSDVSCGGSAFYICEESHDLCDSSPCQNNGVCSVLALNHHVCACPSMISGDNCEIIDSPCYSSPCQNGGVCRENEFSYSCECPEGRSGINCEIRKCADIEVPANGNIRRLGNREFYQPNSYARFQCNIGYRLVGASTIVCQSSYRWTDTVPTCEEIGCRIFITSIPKGVAILRYNLFEYQPGETLDVLCIDRSQNLNLNPTLTCRRGNMWEPNYINYRCA